MKGIGSGDEVFIQILEAEWYGKLVSVDKYGIEFEVSRGRGEGNIVFSTERFTMTKIAKKEDEKTDENKLD